MSALKAVEMMIEPGAETLIRDMGRKMKTRARSKVIDRVLDHLRENEHTSNVSAWFSEQRFLASRRTTVRLSDENTDYITALAAVTGRGRPFYLA
ncbi:MAG: hypothetical protein V3U57_00180 [Robiginitomaculum sp.]